MKPAYQIILASQSPRRQQLLKDLAWDFRIAHIDVEELYPAHLKNNEIAEYLAELKSEAYKPTLEKNELLICADTIVCIGKQTLGKPKNKLEAQQMLKTLQGKTHQVYTGVCIRTNTKKKVFSVRTDVFFKNLSEEEINFYIENYQPFDKAGAYGAQEWLGFVAVEKIEGSYFNVMGLPLKELYETIMTW